LPVWVIHSIRSHSFTYFTAANPAIPFSGLFGESKKDILEKINQEYLPRWIFAAYNEPFFLITDRMKYSGISYPVIAKPNIGERGNKVEKIENEKQLENYLLNSGEDFIVQEYVDYKTELGILYYRMPDGTESGILSVAGKKFLTVTGNGKKTLKELVNQTLMGRMREKYLSKKFKDKWNNIIQDGNEILLEPIGNHSRGTEFINMNHSISPDLVNVFDSVTYSIKGFYYGRFDIRCKSIDDLLQTGNFKILELNGISSDPAHIYDSSMKLWKAYKDLYRCLNIIFKISKQNRKMGTHYAAVGEVWKVLLKYFFKIKKVSSVRVAKPEEAREQVC
jgi:hypothetical protein